MTSQDADRRWVLWAAWCMFAIGSVTVGLIQNGLLERFSSGIQYAVLEIAVAFEAGGLAVGLSGTSFKIVLANTETPTKKKRACGRLLVFWLFASGVLLGISFHWPGVYGRPIALGLIFAALTSVYYGLAGWFLNRALARIWKEAEQIGTDSD